MKKIFTILSIISVIILISGCSLSKTTVDDKSKINKQMSILQIEVERLNYEIQELILQNNGLTSGNQNLIKENEKLRSKVEELKIGDITENGKETNIKKTVVVGGLIKSEEFSINDDRYEIYYQGSQNLIKFFQDNDGGGTEYDDMAVGKNDPTCETTNPESEEYEKKVEYYRDLFSKYSEKDQLKIYSIKDKKLEITEEDKRLGNYNGRGLQIYVMENKLGYTSKEKFIKDFTEHCQITTRTPEFISRKYVIFFGGCYCGAGCSFDCEKIKDGIQEKITIK